jgi:hypothetical protein
MILNYFTKEKQGLIWAIGWHVDGGGRAFSLGPVKQRRRRGGAMASVKRAQAHTTVH